MPHHFINSGMSDIINHSAHKRASSVLKLTDVSFSLLFLFYQFFLAHPSFALMQPAQLAANRAELHRRSIAQMRVCSLLSVPSWHHKLLILMCQCIFFLCGAD